MHWPQNADSVTQVAEHLPVLRGQVVLLGNYLLIFFVKSWMRGVEQYQPCVFRQLKARRDA